MASAGSASSSNVVAALLIASLAVPAVGCGSIVVMPAAAVPDNSTPVSDPVNRSGARYIVGADFPSLASCISGAPSQSTCILPAGYKETEDATLLMAASHLTILCEDAAGLIGPPTGDVLKIAGTDIVVDGCAFTASPGDASGSAVVVRNTAQIWLLNNDFHGFRAASIAIADASQVFVEGNSFADITADAIYAEGSMNGITISDNPLIDVSQRTTWGQAVGIHGASPHAVIRNLDVERNHIVNGYSFCVEIGRFGGENVAAITLRQNTCVQKKARGNYGGYSLVETVDAVVDGNVYDSSAMATGSDLAGIEMTGGMDGSVTNNEVDGLGITLDRQSATTITGNRVNHPWHDVGIYLGADCADAQLTGNLVENNQVSIIRHSSAPLGVWLQCNGANAACTGNRIDNNSLTFLGSRAGAGIRVEREQGEMAANSAERNVIRKFSNCIENGDGSSFAVADNQCE